METSRKSPRNKQVWATGPPPPTASRLFTVEQTPRCCSADRISGLRVCLQLSSVCCHLHVAASARFTPAPPGWFREAQSSEGPEEQLCCGDLPRLGLFSIFGLLRDAEM